MTDDATLVAAYKQGDASAFEALYTKHLRPLYGVVYVRTHHQQTAEDIVSQTFLRALERINTFDPAKGSFGGWLFTIARNLIVDHYRKAKPTSDIQDVWDLADDTDVPRDADAALQARHVRSLLTGLTPEQRDVVLLRIWHGYSFAEIASALGTTEAACKMRYKRSLESLKSAPLAILLLLFPSFLHVLIS